MNKGRFITGSEQCIYDLIGLLVIAGKLITLEIQKVQIFGICITPKKKTKFVKNRPNRQGHYKGYLERKGLSSITIDSESMWSNQK